MYRRNLVTHLVAYAMPHHLRYDLTEMYASNHRRSPPSSIGTADPAHESKERRQ